MGLLRGVGMWFQCVCKRSGSLMRRSSLFSRRGVLSFLLILTTAILLSGCGSSSDGGGIQGTNTQERTFSGSILDPQGQPVQGAQINLVGYEGTSTTTDATGQFKLLADLPQFASVTLSFSTGLATGTLTLELTEDDNEFEITAVADNSKGTVLVQNVSVRVDTTANSADPIAEQSAAEVLDSAANNSSDETSAAPKKNKRKKKNLNGCYRGPNEGEVICPATPPEENSSGASGGDPASEASDTPANSGSIDNLEPTLAPNSGPGVAPGFGSSGGDAAQDSSGASDSTTAEGIGSSSGSAKITL